MCVDVLWCVCVEYVLWRVCVECVLKCCGVCGLSESQVEMALWISVGSVSVFHSGVFACFSVNGRVYFFPSFEECV